MKTVLALRKTVPCLLAGLIIQAFVVDALAQQSVLSRADQQSIQKFGRVIPAVVMPVVQGSSATLVYITEDFEGTTWPPTGWVVVNPDASITWDSTSSASGYGSGVRSAWMDFYSYASRPQFDTLLTPGITGLVSGDSLLFDYAYAEYDNPAFGPDSMIIALSTNGGSTWSVILFRDGGATLATAPPSNPAFIPTPAQWGTKRIALPTSVAGNNVKIAFVGRNEYGNNLFVDNIRIGNPTPPGPAPADTGVVYASTSGFQGATPGGLLTIDKTTGDGTLLGLTGLQSVPGLAIRPSDGIIFGASGGSQGAGGGRLYMISAVNAETTFVANTGRSYLDALAFGPGDTLYGVDGANGDLYRIDDSTGASTLIGNMTAIFVGLAFDPTTGTLYGTTGGITNFQDTLLTVNTSTGVPTVVGPIGLGGPTPDLVFDQTGSLYGVKGGGQNPNVFISINKNTGAGTAIGDSIGFRGVSGLASYVQFLPPVPPAEAFADHVTSAFRGSATNEGNIGFLNGFPGQGGIGSGFQFNTPIPTNNRLFEGAIMIGLDSVRVSNAARNQAQVFDADFQFLSNFDSSQSSGIMQVLGTSYNDALAETPFGVHVSQTTVSFDSAGLSQVLLYQLDVRNTSSSTYSDLTVGGFFDWDVNPTTAADRGAFLRDSMNTIAGVNNGDPFPFDVLELHQGVSPNSWVGVVPLSSNVFRAGRIAESDVEVYPPRMTKGDKWRYMTEMRPINPLGDGGSAQDHAQAVGMGPYSVAADDSVRVGFAVVAGTSLQDIVNSARTAQRLWVERLGNELLIAPVGVGTDPEGIPQQFALEQNYPNPFNPATQIRYALPKESFVTLKVYNILGQEVVSLVNGEQAAGYATVTWDGRNSTGNPVSSGMYFYRIEARATSGGEVFTQVKKMIMLK